jgi:hypothetical protein
VPALTRRKIPLMHRRHRQFGQRRKGGAAVEKILSVLDGKPIRDNVVNKQVLG